MLSLSAAEALALLQPSARDDWLAQLSPADLLELEHHWRFWCRPGQQPPKGDWQGWLIMAGRGYGKTRAGAEWVRQQAEKHPGVRIALVGTTLGEARSVMVEGESGLLAIAPDALRPHWEPSLKRLSWRNGSCAYLYSAAEPDSLRGPQHHFAWGDEIAKWPYGEAVWDMLQMGLRLGDTPQVVATTTPRPVPLLRRLLDQPDIIISHGRTQDNSAHLPEAFLCAMQSQYGGSRLGRQELDGELIAELEGALWTRQQIEACRVRAHAEALAVAMPYARIVIGVDPPASDGGDACGIIVAALGRDGRAYVLEDASVEKASPEQWAQAVAAASARHQADRIIAEANNGGQMVESVLRAVDAGLPVRRVYAARGKVARAEPVAALYAAGRVSHVGAFPALEDQMAGLLLGGTYSGPGRSPDRADALVWCLTELLLRPSLPEPAIRLM